MLVLEQITKRLGDTLALDTVSFKIKSGQTVVIVGSSGAGKTTLLRIIAGLERPDTGKIIGNTNTIWSSGQHWCPPWNRGVGMVFQDLVLWPHMTVAQHLDFTLRQIRKYRSRYVRQQRILQLLDAVGLINMSARLPSELSGGQQQRLALARTIASEPQYFLLDEAFSNLDRALQQTLWELLRHLQREQRFTLLAVTHNQECILEDAHRIFEMHAGRLGEIDKIRAKTLINGMHGVSEYKEHSRDNLEKR